MQRVCTVRIGNRNRALDRRALPPPEPLHLQLSAGGACGPLQVILQKAIAASSAMRRMKLCPCRLPPSPRNRPLPEDVACNDELYLNGLHLEQYRHPTRRTGDLLARGHQARPRRQPLQSCARSLAPEARRIRPGREASPESIARLTMRNPNPRDGEPHYNLGLTLSYQERSDEAYDAFYKSAWNAAWRAPAYHRLAEIDCARADWTAALDHVDRSLRAADRQP